MTSHRHIEEIARYKRALSDLLDKIDETLQGLAWKHDYNSATLGGHRINDLDAAANNARIFLSDSEPTTNNENE
jgi:hypothetical protein